MKSITICGSTKFKLEARKFAESLRTLGVVVYEPHFFSEEKNWVNLNKKQIELIAIGLTFDHFHKIRLGDVVFIYNPGGYCGNSTTLEIGYATALAKPIYALCLDESEICRNVLFKGMVKNPKDLISFLK